MHKHHFLTAIGPVRRSARSQAHTKSHPISRGVRTELQIPDPDRAAASAGPDGSRQAAGAHELGAASEAMGIRH